METRTVTKETTSRWLTARPRWRFLGPVWALAAAIIVVVTLAWIGAVESDAVAAWVSALAAVLSAVLIAGFVDSYVTLRRTVERERAASARNPLRNSLATAGR